MTVKLVLVVLCCLRPYIQRCLRSSLPVVRLSDLPVKVKKTNWYKFLTECNKKIKCPYYFSVNKGGETKEPFIRLYDSKIAMMLALYGDIESYLESVRIRN